MITSRRTFIGGVAGLAIAGPATRALAAEPPAGLAPALEAIRAFAEAHRTWMSLPALTLSVTLPDDFSTVIDTGLANPETRAPIGTQFVLVTYAYQTGDVLTDASLPLRDVKVKLHSSAIGYGRTFALAGRQANLSFLVPYLKGTASGTVFENTLSVNRSGLGDLRTRFSMNIVGSPAVDMKEFAAYKPKTVIGTSQ